MANPEIPVIASFPIPPPTPRLAIVDAKGMPTPYFQEWCQLMWAAIQGKFGLQDEAVLALLGDINFTASFQSAVLTALQASEISFGAQLSAIQAQLQDALIVAWTALGGGASTATPTPDVDDSNWVPTVDGAEPPGFITDGAGVLIFVYYTP